MSTRGRALALIVQSDAELRGRLAAVLRQDDCAVVEASVARQAREALAVHQFDLVILDVALKGESGLGLCRYIRHRRDVPLIVLCGSAGDIDRVVALEMGADDAMKMPTNLAEFAARARNVRRRSTRAETLRGAWSAATFEIGEWRLSARDPVMIHRDGRAVRLTQNEHALLRVLTAHPRTSINRQNLLRALHGDQPNVAPRSIDSQIARLRRKIGDEQGVLIRTVKDAGYALAESAPAESAVGLAGRNDPRSNTL